MILKTLLSILLCGFSATIFAGAETWSWKDLTAQTPDSFKVLPTAKKPWYAEKEDGLREALQKELSRLRHVPANAVYAMPAAADFPGIPDDACPVVTKTVEIDPAIGRWHSTGVYALPGTPLTVTLPPKTELKNGKEIAYSIVVGCHTDKLNLTKHKRWNRVPELSFSKKVDSEITQIANPMGGLVYFSVNHPLKMAKPFQITISGGVTAPLYVRGKTTMEAWRKMIDGPVAPWGEIAAKRIILSLPINILRQIEDPAAIAEAVDSGMSAQDWLVGWDLKPERLKTPMRFVCDRQVGAGSGHSGYPAMGGMSWAKPFGNGDFLNGTTWGFWHETGHNHQSGPYRLPGMGEVTVNIFTIAAGCAITGLPVEKMWKGFDNPQKMLTPYFSDTPRFNEKPGQHFLNLYFFADIIRAHGFEPFRKMAIHAETAPYPARGTAIEQWSYVMRALSKASGKNLAPYFDVWRISLTPESVDAVKDLPVWMPSPDFPKQYIKK